MKKWNSILDCSYAEFKGQLAEVSSRNALEFKSTSRKRQTMASSMPEAWNDDYRALSSFKQSFVASIRFYTRALRLRERARQSIKLRVKLRNSQPAVDER